MVVITIFLLLESPPKSVQYQRVAHSTQNSTDDSINICCAIAQYLAQSVTLIHAHKIKVACFEIV